jgi:hypothetical protein
MLARRECIQFALVNGTLDDARQEMHSMPVRLTVPSYVFFDAGKAKHESTCVQ